MNEEPHSIYDIGRLRTRYQERGSAAASYHPDISLKVAFL